MQVPHAKIRATSICLPPSNHPCIYLATTLRSISSPIEPSQPRTLACTHVLVVSYVNAADVPHHPIHDVKLRAKIPENHILFYPKRVSSSVRSSTYIFTQRYRRDAVWSLFLIQVIRRGHCGAFFNGVAWIQTHSIDTISCAIINYVSVLAQSLVHVVLKQQVDTLVNMYDNRRQIKRLNVV